MSIVVPFAEQETTATVYDAGAGTRRLILGHGAGAGQRSPFMVRWAEGLRARGITVVTFDFGYMARGKKLPDRTPLLEACFRAVVDQLGGERPAIGGKSMGGRMASHLCADPLLADRFSGLVLFGYPLHPPGKPEQLRVAHLPRITCPVLVLQGERDPFGGPDELRPHFSALRGMRLRAVPGGDHSLEVRPRRLQAELDATLQDEVAEFLKNL